ncbi:unnamed protein product [Prorocentrum cordatum]|uniref:EF-hand domain-containing protein n=1 Tax=Prorocentrum cordatum TaxID=2364126 RepID=A0ABN9TLL8_9DINO|nr:unnamed protein product [Polarella glacialis]
MSAVKSSVAAAIRFVLSVHGLIVVTGRMASDVQLIQARVVDQHSPSLPPDIIFGGQGSGTKRADVVGCVDDDEGAVRFANHYARSNDVGGCADVGPHCEKGNFTSKLHELCCATCSDVVKENPHLHKCTDHSSCWSGAFCYDGVCDSCSHCEFCSDAAYADERGHCGPGFPTQESEPCHSQVTYGPLYVVHAWANLSSEEELVHLEKMFGDLDKDASSTLDVDELIGTLIGQDLVALEAAMGTLHVDLDSVKLPRGSVQEFVEKHSKTGSAFLTLGEWLGARVPPASDGRAVAPVATSSSCSLSTIVSVSSTCTVSQAAETCGSVCANACNSCRRVAAHPNSSSVARAPQELEKWWWYYYYDDTRRRRRWVDVITDVVDDVVCTVSCT